jgi:flagellin
MASFGDYNRVNTNVTAMDAQLSLNKINRDLGDSRLKLSTGFKINNAEDDAAGFAIATKLKSRVAGLEQALQNVSDAKSMLGIVEGAYGSIMDNLIEMKTLSTQASNDTMSATERTYIAKQINALSHDVNDIAASATFNGVALLPSSTTTGAAGDSALTFQVGEATTDTKTITFKAVDIFQLFGADGTDLGGTDGAPDDIIEVTDLRAGGDTANQYVSSDTEARGEIEFEVTANTATTGTATEVDAQAADFRRLTSLVDTAIEELNGYLNQVGIDQRSLSGKEVNLTEAITANSAARSRIMDTDFAKEQSNSIRLQILQQTATAALSQANMGPQAVLGFLG